MNQFEELKEILTLIGIAPKERTSEAVEHEEANEEESANPESKSRNLKRINTEDIPEKNIKKNNQ
jgi:hypothetical protein